MKTTHVIELSTGKAIKLTDEEYEELRGAFKRTVYAPPWPSYPYIISPCPWGEAETTTGTTIYTDNTQPKPDDD